MVLKMPSEGNDVCSRFGAVRWDGGPRVRSGALVAVEREGVAHASASCGDDVVYGPRRMVT